MIQITDEQHSHISIRPDAISLILIPSALMGAANVKPTIFVGPVGIIVSATEARRVRDLLDPPTEG